MQRRTIAWALGEYFSTCVFILAIVILATSPAAGQNYRVERIASGLAQPTYVAQAPGDPANIIYYSTRITAENGTGGGFSATKSMGGIFRYDMNTRTSTKIMDLSHRPLVGDEGLVGFAFSPDFNTPGAPGFQKLYVSSSEYNGSFEIAPTERVEEYTANGPGGIVPVDGSGHAIVSRLILQYDNINTNQNHTVNWIGFDPTAAALPVGSPERNYLYISAGDGDLGGNAQSRPEQKANSVLGKVLRVDVDVDGHGDAYPLDANKNFSIPASNPVPLWNSTHSGSQQLTGTHLNYSGGFPTSANYGPALDEIYFTGTRNTFRMSIDRQTGDYWMGDIGENSREEINFLKAGTYDGSQPPVDFGYAQREGTRATNSSLAVANSSGATSIQWNLSGGGTVTVNSTNPIREGDHSATNTDDHPTTNRSAYIGGYVYSGTIAELQGKYIYADFVNSNMFALSDFDRDTPLSSYSGTNFNQNPTTLLAALGTRTTLATPDVNSLWNSLIYDRSDPSYTSALGAMFGIGRIVSLGEDNGGNLYLIDFGGPRGDPSFGGDYPHAGTGQIFMLVPSVPGDYNDDRIVNAADYTVWRDHLGQSFVLPNEVPGVTPGVVTTEDYEEWAARFGNSLSGAGAGGPSSVPEPGALGLGLMAAVACFGFRPRLVKPKSVAIPWPKSAKATVSGTTSGPASKVRSSTQRSSSGNGSAALCCRLFHHAFDQGDDDHQDSAAHAAAGDVGEHRLEVQAAFVHGHTQCVEHGHARAAAQDADDRIQERAQALVFHYGARDVSAHRATDQIDDQTDDVHVHLQNIANRTEQLARPKPARKRQSEKKGESTNDDPSDFHCNSCGGDAMG